MNFRVEFDYTIVLALGVFYFKTVWLLLIFLPTFTATFFLTGMTFNLSGVALMGEIILTFLSVGSVETLFSVFQIGAYVEDLSDGTSSLSDSPLLRGRS